MELDEAGAIDGAGTLATFFHLYRPLIVPPLIALGAYAFRSAWKPSTCTRCYCSPAGAKGGVELSDDG